MSPRVVEATPAHATAISALLGAHTQGCACRYWHFEGDKNSWLQRCFGEPERNVADQTTALMEQREDGRGVVALDGADAAIGWLKLARAHAVPKLYAQRLYRGLPCFAGDRASVAVVACLFVPDGARREGVARAMLAKAIDVAASWGATSLEALPRRGARLGDHELPLGPASLFEGAGFVVVHDHPQYPVLRRSLP